MIDLASAVVFFSLFVITHILSVRTGLLKPGIPPIVMLSSFWLLGEIGCLGTPLISAPLVTYALLSMWYIAEYTLIQYESPSLKMMRFIDRNPQRKVL